MNKITLPVLLVFFLFTVTLCVMDPETYQELKEKAPYELLEYEKVVEKFKDLKQLGPEISKKFRMEDIRLAKEILEARAEKEPFLALTKTQISLPKEWDWRKIKPECFNPPMDQQYCGSCYIFATTSALEERFCIKSNAKIKLTLSQQDVLSCDLNHSKCEGGTLLKTWEFLENFGTCSYHCKPYVSFDGSVPRCYSSCDNSIFSYYKWKAKKNSAALIFGDHQKIKEEIYLNGPVSTSMETWEDMSAFKGASYYFHLVGKQTDDHAITLVGWGYDQTYNKDYWIIRNSWGTDWGDKGYFKVLAGLYTIGEFVVASKPEI